MELWNDTMKGTESFVVADKNTGAVIKVSCITPEARDLLDELCKAYEDFFGIKPEEETKNPPNPYKVLYWVCRYSGLVKRNE